MAFQREALIKGFLGESNTLKISPPMDKPISVGNDKLRKLIEKLKNRKAVLILEDTGLKYEVIGVKSELEITVRGFKKISELEKNPVFLREEDSHGFLHIDLSGFADIGAVASGDVLFYVLWIIMLLVVSLLLVDLIAIFLYAVVYPTVLIISSIFTLGEAWRMRGKRKLAIRVDTSDENFLENLEKLVRLVIENKGSVDPVIPIINEDLLSKAYRMKRIYSLYSNGLNAQSLALFTGMIFGVIWFINRDIISGYLFWILEILGVIYLTGLALTIVAAIERRRTETAFLL
ncbi:MAG: hypothetical protein ACP6IP_07165 [Candidatus Njordarchaeia archaeon]